MYPEYRHSNTHCVLTIYDSAPRLAVAAPLGTNKNGHSAVCSVQCGPTGHFVALKLNWGSVGTITIVIYIDIIPYQALLLLFQTEDRLYFLF